MSSKEHKMLEQVSAYLDGQLSEPEAQAVAQALAADDRLTAELDQLGATRRLVSSLDRVKAPQGLLEAAMDKAQRRSLVTGHSEHDRAGLLAHWHRWAAVAAAIMLAVGAGLLARVAWNDSPFDSRAVVTNGQKPNHGSGGGEMPIVIAGRGEEPNNEHDEPLVDVVPIGRAGQDRLANGLEQAANAQNMLGELNISLPNENNLLVSTTDVNDARRRVQQVLLDNGIAKPLELAANAGLTVQFYFLAQPQQKRQLTHQLALDRIAVQNVATTQASQAALNLRNNFRSQAGDDLYARQISQIKQYNKDAQAQAPAAEPVIITVQAIQSVEASVIRQDADGATTNK